MTSRADNSHLHMKCGLLTHCYRGVDEWLMQRRHRNLQYVSRKEGGEMERSSYGSALRLLCAVVTML